MMKIKNDHELIIRKATVEDANEIVMLVKQVMGEVSFFPKEPDEFDLTAEDEAEYIKNTSLFLVAEIDGKIVGSTTLQKGSTKRTSHVADFGITILREYSGLKIGTLLMEEIIKWCKENQVEKIELEVFEENTPAITLYKKFGFIEEGRKNKNIKIKGEYKNTLLLASFLKYS
ncbi:GNAT family N-acetyltransferase [Clostridium sp.]|uniref:GNAT family N-acetyltransferase n=1 Tax=Clostridium sp. TaxID=1506 RepID=UPI0032165CE2